MSFNLDDVLNDRNQFADTLEIDIGGQKTTVGEVRARYMPKGDWTKATQRATELERQVQQSAQQQAYLQQQLQAALATRGQALPENRDELDQLIQEYPGLAPIASRLRQQEQKMAESLQRMQQHELVFNTAQHAQMYDRIRQQDPEYASEENRNKLVNYALQNGIRRLDLAHQLLTRERETAKAAEQARLAGIEEGKKLARTPQIFGGGKRTASTAAPHAPTNFQEAEDAALADPEILSIMQGSATA